MYIDWSIEQRESHFPIAEEIVNRELDFPFLSAINILAYTACQYMQWKIELNDEGD